MSSDQDLTILLTRDQQSELMILLGQYQVRFEILAPP